MDDDIVIMQRIDNRMPNQGVQGQFNQPITINNTPIDYVYVLCCCTESGTVIISSAFRDEIRAKDEMIAMNEVARGKEPRLDYYIEKHMLR